MTSPLKGPKRVIWETLCENGNQPLSAYQLLDKVQQYGIKHAPTIYRALHKLEELGLIHRIASLNAVVACNPAPSRNIVGMLICKRCNQVTIVEDKLLEDAVRRLGHEHHYLVERQVIEIIAVCPACRDTEADSSNERYRRGSSD